MTAAATQFAITPAASDDLSLVRAARAGDVAAFEELVRRYDRRLFRIAHQFTHNYEDAQDLVQDAFLKAYKNLNQFREQSKFSTWLIRITINEGLMKVRKQRTHKEVRLEQDLELEEGTIPLDVADWAPDPEKRYQVSEIRRLLMEALQHLHLPLRVVFVLRDIEGLSLEQTAEALDLTVSAIKARSRRARLQLREILSKHFRKPDQASQREALEGIDTLHDYAVVTLKSLEAAMERPISAITRNLTNPAE